MGAAAFASNCTDYSCQWPVVRCADRT